MPEGFQPTLSYDLPARDASREQKKSVIDDIITDLSTDSDSYTVYVLRCEQPKPNEVMKNEISGYYPNYPVSPASADYGPGWAEQAIEAETHYYIGQTSDLSSRLYKHVAGTSDSALFTTLFPPESLVHTESTEELSQAKDRETGLTRQINYYGTLNLSEEKIDNTVPEIQHQLNEIAADVGEKVAAGEYSRRVLFDAWIGVFCEALSNTGISNEIETSTAETVARNFFKPDEFGADHWLLNEYMVHHEYTIDSSQEAEQMWKGLTNDGVHNLLNAISMGYRDNVMAYSM